MEYHKTSKVIIDLLQNNNFWFETFEHEPVRTSEEAAKIRHGYSLHQGAKALVIRVKKTEKDKKFAMLVIPGDSRFDKEKVKRLFGAKDIRFATEEEVKKIMEEIEPGGVPPFGNLFGLEVFADKTLFDNPKIIFNAGDRRFSVAVKSKDYCELVKPRVETII